MNILAEQGTVQSHVIYGLDELSGFCSGLSNEFLTWQRQVKREAYTYPKVSVDASQNPTRRHA
jgi:hypothetical protein